MKVLVTGASGFVGNHLVAALLQAGHTVRGLSRKEPEGARRHSGVEYVNGVDVGDPTSLTPAMFEGIEGIAHLVGIIQEAKPGQTFERIHVEGTQNLVQWAVGQGFKGRFVYLSAIGSAPDSPAEYSRSKYEAEQIVIRSGLPYTIFRPSLVLGKDGEFVAQMADLIKHGGLPAKLPFPFIPVPGSGKNKFQPIYVEDLCSAITKSITLPAAANQLYEVGGATQLSFNYLIKGLADAMNVKKPMLHAPIPILKIVATIMEAVMPKPPVTRDQLANLGLDNITDSHALSQVFGIQPLSFDQQIARIYGK